MITNGADVAMASTTGPGHLFPMVDYPKYRLEDACLVRFRPTADKSQLGGAPGYCRVMDPSGPTSRSDDFHMWLSPSTVALHLRMLCVALEATNALPPDNFPRPVANLTKGVPTAEELSTPSTLAAARRTARHTTSLEIGKLGRTTEALLDTVAMSGGPRSSCHRRSRRRLCSAPWNLTTSPGAGFVSPIPIALMSKQTNL